MSQELRILILEDEPADAELTERELRKVHLTFTAQRVETREAFLRALTEFTPELILADYSLPSFDGLSALAMAQAQCPNTPFIFVSGTIGEEMAIDILKRGATDYILKHRLTKLGPVVRRTLQEMEDQQARRRAERLKGELLEVLSHELCTPLSVIQEGMSQLADGMLGPVTADQAECLTITTESLKRLGRLFEKILLATQLMTGKLEYHSQSIGIAKLLQDLREHCKALATSRGVTLHLNGGDEPVSCLGDGKLLAAALQELVENAIQATPQGGDVHLSWTPTPGSVMRG